MYKHILLPTDGSDLSQRAIKAGIEFAKAVGARVSGFHVAPYPPFNATEEWQPVETMSWERFEEAFRRRAERYLAVIEEAAKQAGVPCACSYVMSDFPYEEIIKTAEEKGCDLIFMASHGRKGLKGLLMGSVTVKVLTHSRIPVLVYR